MEVFLEQEVHDYQLGNFRGNGTKLIRSLVGTTAQNHICYLCSRGFTEAGDGHKLDLIPVQQHIVCHFLLRGWKLIIGGMDFLDDIRLSGHSMTSFL